MNIDNHRSSSRVDEYGQDPFALTENCDYPPLSKTMKVVSPITGDDKPAEDDDEEVAIPLPIATLVFQDGRTEPVYKPLAGHEHLFKARPMIGSPASFSNRASSIQRPIQPAPTQVPGTPQHATLEPRQKAKSQRQPAPCKQRKPVAHRQGLLNSKSLKRTRSVAQGLAPNRKAFVDNDDVDDTDETVQVVTEESHTFYIGDIDAFKEFLRCRFDELTMKPLRGIATHWVKLLEPRRLGDWGKYHEMLPTEADTPPWWPNTVIYKEPSHLKKSDLSTLAVEMMLVHREIDEVKRKGSWITKLRDVAKFTVQTTSADHFSSSKGAAHSEEMKKRALEQILPSIFDVAQAYEDHIMQYSLFEGSGNADPGRGKHHTWKPIPRPVRRQQPKRPRRTVKGRPDTVQETICEASGDETEPDDTMTRLARVPHGLPQAAPSPRPMTAHSQPEIQTPRQFTIADDSHRQTWKADTPASISGPCTPATSQDDSKMHRTASTPNSSFDQSLHGLHLGEEDLNLKPHARTMSDNGTMHPPYNMVPYNQPVQYPAAPTGFSGQAYQPTDNYPNPAPSSFPQNGPTFINPFTMFNAPPPPISYTQYASPMSTANGFPYEQGIFSPTPMSFPNTPMSMPITPSDPNMTFHGLPSDYPVDPQGLHHF
ncbi:hypothetical protein BU25DRAFT_461448 [Macroventuria anomochaeta]|uniref:Uncharacterized protein n=1 Tax=Macroventuria anomochaeta TaxID=301207 RepID=A0ACB6RQC2_9PLEO|nr:uncharacterized protein BU25DRAFT_461448 [Macroventuria anomochaeta]KAF2623938.1 hypothetical protein BU25DRAFT_461448 [Macroventuria anomochaeta]